MSPVPAMSRTNASRSSSGPSEAMSLRAYQKYESLFSGPRWQKLADKGAKTQRVLWASTGTKNPKYSDVLYIEELVGPDTVNTIPPATLDAFRDHGKVRRTLDQGVDEADAVMRKLEQSGISMKSITDQLVDDGVKSFSESVSELLSAVGGRLKGGGGRK